MPLTPNAGPAKPYPLDTDGSSVKFSMGQDGKAEGTRTFFLSSLDIANYTDTLLGYATSGAVTCFPDLLPIPGVALLCDSVEFEPIAGVATCDAGTGMVVYPMGEAVPPTGFNLDMKGTAKYKEATVFNAETSEAIPLYEETLVPWIQTLSLNPRDTFMYMSVKNENDATESGLGAKFFGKPGTTAVTEPQQLTEGFDSVVHTIAGFDFTMTFRRRTTLPVGIMDTLNKTNSTAVASLSYGITFPPQSLLITDIRPTRFTRPGGGFLWDLTMKMSYMPTFGFGPTSTYSPPSQVIGGWNQHYNYRARYTTSNTFAPVRIGTGNEDASFEQLLTFVPESFSFLTAI